MKTIKCSLVLLTILLASCNSFQRKRTVTVQEKEEFVDQQVITNILETSPSDPIKKINSIHFTPPVLANDDEVRILAF